MDFFGLDDELMDVESIFEFDDKDIEDNVQTFNLPNNTNFHMGQKMETPRDCLSVESTDSTRSTSIRLERKNEPKFFPKPSAKRKISRLGEQNLMEHKPVHKGRRVTDQSKAKLSHIYSMLNNNKPQSKPAPRTDFDAVCASLAQKDQAGLSDLYIKQLLSWK